jgi:hypothetical protein
MKKKTSRGTGFEAKKRNNKRVKGQKLVNGNTE